MVEGKVYSLRDIDNGCEGSNLSFKFVIAP